MWFCEEVTCQSRPPKAGDSGDRLTQQKTDGWQSEMAVEATSRVPDIKQRSRTERRTTFPAFPPSRLRPQPCSPHRNLLLGFTLLWLPLTLAAVSRFTGQDHSDFPYSSIQDMQIEFLSVYETRSKTYQVMMDNVEHAHFDINGFSLHVAHTGQGKLDTVLFLHRFTEIRYSWRHQCSPSSALGFRRSLLTSTAIASPAGIKRGFLSHLRRCSRSLRRCSRMQHGWLLMQGGRQ
ncbi:hypothetical protein ZIOFF_003981 [Zingiber officinale]|uniref:Uncharacterized protein n=1 Tax=Zingiber officinale TaxID=94328 RepID=A0A8J5MAX3_ZINOF|nr:hypothetical protein ZIOFF_003981 [Zingiber officinale]